MLDTKTSGARSARAAVAVLLLSAPTFGVTVISPTDPSLQGTVIASQTVPILSYFDSSIPNLLVDEKVVQTTAGTLDFYYKVLNPPNQFTTLMDFGGGFPEGDYLQLDVAYLDEGNLAPSSAAVTTTGGTTSAAWHFGPDGEVRGVPIPDAGTDWLLLRTNASAYSISTLGGVRGLDDLIISAPAFAPDGNSVPEPTALAMLSVGILGLAIKFRRR